MRFLDEMELFLTEEKDRYNLYPVDYDLDSGFSFGVDLSDDDEVLAKIAIKLIDGTPIDALNGNYNYKDVYADVDVEGDVDDPRNSDVMLWVLKKLKNMGYDEQTIRFDGEDYYRKPENLSDVTTDDDEPAQSDSEFDPSTYWKDEDDDDESDTELTSDYQVPSEPSEPSEDEDDSYESLFTDEDETTSDDEDDDDDEEPKKKNPWD